MLYMSPDWVGVLSAMGAGWLAVMHLTLCFSELPLKFCSGSPHWADPLMKVNMSATSRISRVLVSAAVALGLVAGGTPAIQALAPEATVATAQAATSVAKKVTVKKIPNKKVKGSAKATVKPKYSKGKKVKVKSAKLTVKKGKKTVAKNKKSVKLKAGTYKVTTTVKYSLKGKKKVYKVSKKQTLKVIKTKAKAKKKRGTRHVPISKKNCPAAYPVKGNRGNYDWIYHVPGGRYYKVTNPEDCFSSAAAARKAGYRASKNG